MGEPGGLWPHQRAAGTQPDGPGEGGSSAAEMGVCTGGGGAPNLVLRSALMINAEVG